METLYHIHEDKKTYQRTVKEFVPYHRENKFCGSCGTNMEFALVRYGANDRFSTWTGNEKFMLSERCNTCSTSFRFRDVFRNKYDGLLYVNDFTLLEDYINYKDSYSIYTEKKND